MRWVWGTKVKAGIRTVGMVLDCDVRRSGGEGVRTEGVDADRGGVGITGEEEWVDEVADRVAGMVVQV